MPMQAANGADNSYASTSSRPSMSGYGDMNLAGNGSNSTNNAHFNIEPRNTTMRDMSASPPRNGNDNDGHESASSSKASNGKRSSNSNKPKANNQNDTADDSDGKNTSINDGSGGGKRQKLTRIHQACVNCGLKKQKCSGGHPCESCRSNGLECAYKESKKR